MSYDGFSDGSSLIVIPYIAYSNSGWNAAKSLRTASLRSQPVAAGGQRDQCSFNGVMGGG